MKGVNWQSAAICRDEDPELFFPMGHGPATDKQVLAAKLVCLRCPMEQQCRDWAISQRVEFGIYGGQTENERSAEIRRLNDPRRRPYMGKKWRGSVRVK